MVDREVFLHNALTVNCKSGTKSQFHTSYSGRYVCLGTRIGGCHWLRPVPRRKKYLSRQRLLAFINRAIRNPISSLAHKILHRPENCGWVLFPDGTEQATFGQAHTSMTLPDSKGVPIVFKPLRKCHVPVALGQDFIFEHDIYTRYASSIIEYDDLDSGDELMPMGFRWNRSKAKKPGAGAGTKPRDDLEQNLDWDLKHQYGRTTPIGEWNLEHARRERYERSRNTNWQPDPSIPFIERKLNCSRIERQPLTQPSVVPSRHDGADEANDTSSSFESDESTLESASTSSTAVKNRIGGRDGYPYSTDCL
jgi:hypothetical protein